MTSRDETFERLNETFERLNQYLYKKFNEDDDSQKGSIIELLQKHYSSVNHSYVEKIIELFNHFKRDPSYIPVTYDIYNADTVLTKEARTEAGSKAYFNMYITTKLREIYYFDDEPEKNIGKSRCSIGSLRSLGSFNVFKCYYNESYDAKEQKRLYNTFITELKDLMESEAREANADKPSETGKPSEPGKPDKPGKPSEPSEPDKPTKKKKKPISATVKRLVWNTNIGEDIGKAKCMCCKTTDITQMSFHCGHIFAEANGGDTIVSNLKPICQNCNSSMGTKNMTDFMESLR
jgi:hypothetical protein